MREIAEERPFGRARPLLAAACLTTLGGCGPGPDVVATVGETQITVDEVRRLRDQATPWLQEELGTGRDYLQALIDKELMLLEARDRWLDQDPDLQWRLLVEKQRRIVDRFLADEVGARIDLSDEELERRFQETKWSRSLKLAHIRLRTPEQAAAALDRLRAGEPFEEVAREVSIARTAAEGGRLKPWFSGTYLLEMGMLEVAEDLFDRAVGERSGPHEVEGGYEIFRVLAEGPAPEAERQAFLRREFAREFEEGRQELARQLEASSGVVWHAEALAVLTVRGPEPVSALDLSPDEAGRVLCEFSGDFVDLGAFERHYLAARRQSPVRLDSASVVAFVRQRILHDALLYHAARRDGLEDDPEIVRWHQAREESLLLEALREALFRRDVTVDSAGVRAYYEANREKFKDLTSGELRVREILVDDLGRAEELARRVRQGESLAALAAAHSMRADVDSGLVHMHVHPASRGLYGFLYEAAVLAPMGQVMGPVEGKEGFSVFEVESRSELRQKSFEEAYRQAEWWVRKAEEKRVFEEMIADLRRRHASEVVVHEDRLAGVDSTRT